MVSIRIRMKSCIAVNPKTYYIGPTDLPLASFPLVDSFQSPTPRLVNWFHRQHLDFLLYQEKKHHLKELHLSFRHLTALPCQIQHPL